jgi:hypothetical protein
MKTNASILLFVISLYSCSTFRVNTPDIKTSVDNLANSIQNIDPIALKQLLTDNKDLNTKLNSLTETLNEISSGAPIIKIANNQIELAITNYWGNFRINGWIDVKDNWFWKDEIVGTDPAIINLNYDIIIQRINDWFSEKNIKFADKNTNKQILEYININKPIFINDLKSTINDFSGIYVNNTYFGGISTAFGDRNDVVKSSHPTILGPFISKYVDLRSNFRSLGMHTIYIDIEPIITGSRDDWYIHGSLIMLDDKSKNIEVLKEFSIDCYNKSALDENNNPKPVTIQVVIGQ